MAGRSLFPDKMCPGHIVFGQKQLSLSLLAYHTFILSTIVLVGCNALSLLSVLVVNLTSHSYIYIHIYIFNTVNIITTSSIEWYCKIN